jgi:hypothetical protein
MDNFPSNSHKVVDTNKPKDKATKNTEKVTTGEVILRKKPFGERFKNVFFGGELKGATRYIATDVLLPALKNLVVDATSKGIERVIYGDTGPRRRTGPEFNRPRVSYNSPVDRGYSRPRPGMLPDQPPVYGRDRGRRQSIGDIILASKQDADAALERMLDIVDKFDVASIADLYEIVGLPSSYIDNQWGWTNLAYVEVRQTREGYVIDLPPAESL